MNTPSPWKFPLVLLSSCLLLLHHHCHHHHHPQANTDLLSLYSICIFLIVMYKCNHSIYNLAGGVGVVLAFLMQHNYFEIHSYGCIYQKFISLFSLRNSSFIPQFVYSFSYRWTFELFPVIGYYKYSFFEHSCASVCIGIWKVNWLDPVVGISLAF